MASKPVVLRFLGDTKDLEAALRRVKQKTDETTAGFDRAAARMQAAGEKMASFGKKMSTTVSLPLVAAGAAAIKFASDLTESTTMVERVFGAQATSIKEWAKTAATSFGLSRSEAQQAAGTFGNLFRSWKLGLPVSTEMSKRLVQLGADLASFKNTSLDQALEALQSGLVGQIRPLRQYGVDLSDVRVQQEAVALGLAHQGEALTQTQKLQARYNIILKDTAIAQGDFSRTADNFANKTRIMQAQLKDAAAELGTNLLPLAQKAVGSVTGLAKAFAEMPEPLQNAALAGAALLAAVGPITFAAGKGIEVVTGLAKAVVFLATSESAAAIASSAFGLSLAGIGAGIGATVVVLNAFHRANTALIDSQAEAINNAALGAQATKKQVVDAYTDAFTYTHAATEATKNYAATFGPLQEKARAALGDISSHTGVSKERIVELANSLGINLGRMTDQAREKLSAAVAQISRAITPTERLKEATDSLASKFATSTEAADAWAESVSAVVEKFITGPSAALEFADAIAALGEAVDAQQKKSVAATDDPAKRARDVESARRDVAAASERIADIDAKILELNNRNLAVDLQRAQLAAHEAQTSVERARLERDKVAQEIARKSAMGAAVGQNEMADLQIRLAEANDALAEATQNAADKQKDLNDVQSGAARERDLRDLTNQRADAVDSLADANDRLKDAQDNTRSSADKLEKTNNDVNKSFLGVLQAAVNAANGIDGSPRQKLDKLRELLQQVADKFPQFGPRVREFLSAFDPIAGKLEPTNQALYRMNTQLNAAKDNVAQLLSFYQELVAFSAGAPAPNVAQPGSAGLIGIYGSVTGQQPAPTGPYTGGGTSVRRATGGLIPWGTWGVIGDGGGPEPVMPTLQGLQVMPHAQALGIGGSSGPAFNFNGPLIGEVKGGDGDDIAAATVRHLRDLQYLLGG